MKLPLQIIIAGIVAVLLICFASPAVMAQTSENSAPFPADELGTNIRNGTVVFMTPNHMVVTCRHKGKTAQLDLVLDRVTVQKGKIAVGSPVIVHYRTKDNRNFATSIQLRKYQRKTDPESMQR